MFVLLELIFSNVLLDPLGYSGYKKGLLLLFVQLCVFVNNYLAKSIHSTSALVSQLHLQLKTQECELF